MFPERRRHQCYQVFGLYVLLSQLHHHQKEQAVLRAKRGHLHRVMRRPDFKQPSFSALQQAESLSIG